MKSKMLLCTIAIMVIAAIVGLVACQKRAPEEVTKEDVESYLQDASRSDVKDIISNTVPQDVISEVATQPRNITVGIMHFSTIPGTTWSGAHDAALKRLENLYPWLNYVYEEEIGPEESIPVGEDLIKNKGANIVIGNASFMGEPLLDIADDYPDVYFGTVIESTAERKRNFIRFFPRQYQGFYLAGLVAGAITRTNNIGMVSAFPVVQVHRRAAGFYLGIKDANPNATLYIKYAGGWHDPPTETEISRTLIDQYGCDVLTQQTDSSAPVEVAGAEGIWFIGKDLDLVGLGWSDVNTVAVSFDTRWDVVYEKIIKDYMAGDEYPDNLIFVGMEDRMFLKDEEVPAVDIVNNKVRGVDGISPKALPLISKATLELIEETRGLMLSGKWDPFLKKLKDQTGKVRKEADVMPSDEWLLTELDFDLYGVKVLK